MAGWVNLPTVHEGAEADAFYERVTAAGSPEAYRGALLRAPTDETSQGVVVKENRTLAVGWRAVLDAWARQVGLAQRLQVRAVMHVAFVALAT